MGFAICINQSGPYCVTEP